jgi:hypothetical protein
MFGTTEEIFSLQFVRALLDEREKAWRNTFSDHAKLQEQAITAVAVAADKAVVKADAAAERRYLDAQIQGVKETFWNLLKSEKDAIGVALSAADKAVLKAEAAAEKRFESVNEFRETLSDQQRTFVLKSEVDYRFAAIEEKLTLATATLIETRGKGNGMNAAWGYIIGAAGLLAALASVISEVVSRSH